MASQIVLRTVRIGIQTIKVGSTIDDVQVDTTNFADSLWPASDAVVAAAALVITNRRIGSGIDEAEAERILADAVSKVQRTGDSTAGSNDTTHAAALAALNQKRTVTVGQADLTAAVNGTAQAINIGAALPANARIRGAQLKLATPFTGGGASAVTVDIGTAEDVDAIVDGADVFAAAVDGYASSMPLGIAPFKHFPTSKQLIATFTPDGGATLLALTAGSVVIDVEYDVLA